MKFRPLLISSCAVLLASAAFACLPAKAHAQAFGFSIGSSGGHHHHRTGWWAGYGVGPYWGPGWYPPPAVIYAAPPPVVQQPVIYVQPTTPTVLPPATPYSSTAPSTPARTALAANSAPSFTGTTASDDRIVIRNAAGASLPVSFVVDGQDVELNDGSTRTFVGRANRTIQFDRGGHFGSTQQDLAGGQYEFRITATGWDLVRKPDLASSRTAVRANSLPETR